MSTLLLISIIINVYVTCLFPSKKFFKIRWTIKKYRIIINYIKVWVTCEVNYAEKFLSPCFWSHFRHLKNRHKLFDPEIQHLFYHFLDNWVILWEFVKGKASCLCFFTWSILICFLSRCLFLPPRINNYKFILLLSHQL